MNDVDIVINNVTNGENTIKSKSKNRIISAIAISAVISLLTFGIVTYMISQKRSDVIINQATESPYVQASQCDYILNTNTKKAHKTGCWYVSKIDAENREEYHGTDEELQNKGYTPCKYCSAL